MRNIKYLFRGITIVLASIILIGMFSGCGLIQDIVKMEMSYQLEETEPEITESKKIEYVNDAYFDSYESVYTEYNHTTGEYSEKTTVCEYHIPQINIPGEGIQQINQELYTDLVAKTKQSIESMEQYGTAEVYGISYKWMANGDIVSVVLHIRYGAEYGGSRYMVHNVSISGGRTISDEELFAAVGITKEEYLIKARGVIKKEFWAIASGFDGQIRESEYAYQMEELTLSQESIDRAMPYLNEKGQLCIIACRYPIIGDEYRWDDLNLIDYVPSSP